MFLFDLKISLICEWVLW